jgi:hypothetical protein
LTTRFAAALRRFWGAGKEGGDAGESVSLGVSLGVSDGSVSWLGLKRRSVSLLMMLGCRLRRFRGLRGSVMVVAEIEQ